MYEFLKWVQCDQKKRAELKTDPLRNAVDLSLAPTGGSDLWWSEAARESEEHRGRMKPLCRAVTGQPRITIRGKEGWMGLMYLFEHDRVGSGPQEVDNLEGRRKTFHIQVDVFKENLIYAHCWVRKMPITYHTDMKPNVYSFCLTHTSLVHTVHWYHQFTKLWSAEVLF